MTLGQRTAASDPGRKRRRNEDSYVLEPPLFAVADGMGGAQAGEIASRIAASVLREAPRGGSPQRAEAFTCSRAPSRPTAALCSRLVTSVSVRKR